MPLFHSSHSYALSIIFLPAVAWYFFKIVFFALGNAIGFVLHRSLFRGFLYVFFCSVLSHSVFKSSFFNRGLLGGDPNLEECPDWIGLEPTVMIVRLIKVWRPKLVSNFIKRVSVG